jgi:hypothetical protein
VLDIATINAWDEVPASMLRQLAPVSASKPLDGTAIVSNTTLANDPDLALNLLAGVTYSLRGRLIITGAAAAGGLALAFTWPAGVVVDWEGWGLAVAGGANVNAVRSASGASSPYGTSGATPVAAWVTGTIQAAAANFTLQAQVAQSASNATGTVVKARSYLRADPM